MLNGIFIVSIIASFIEIVKESFCQSKNTNEIIISNLNDGFTRDDIIIENYKLYHEDVQTYGLRIAKEWARNGKYNLSTEELGAEREMHRKKMENLYSLL